MDKWKPSELEKMKVGGNKKLNEFLEEHDDFNEQWTIGTALMFDHFGIIFIWSIFGF